MLTCMTRMARMLTHVLTRMTRWLAGSHIIHTLSGSIIFLDRDGWPFVLSNDGRKIPATLSFLSAIMHKKKFFVVFSPTILTGPQFVETQKFCYHGSVTSPFFYTVGSNSWLGKILDQIITWGKIHLN